MLPSRLVASPVLATRTPGANLAEINRRRIAGRGWCVRQTGRRGIRGHPAVLDRGKTLAVTSPRWHKECCMATNTQRFRQLIEVSEILIQPGIHDGFSARLVEQMGFQSARELERRFLTGAQR